MIRIPHDMSHGLIRALHLTRPSRVVVDRAVPDLRAQHPTLYLVVGEGCRLWSHGVVIREPELPLAPGVPIEAVHPGSPGHEHGARNISSGLLLRNQDSGPRTLE